MGGYYCRQGLREIEEDLHMGIYLLILVIVVPLCLSFLDLDSFCGNSEMC